MPRIIRAIVTSIILASTVHAGVVINEIMYRPGTTFPEDTRREFIELHNTDVAAVNIAGWAFTSGISYTFPAGTMIPAGGFVLVSANPNEAQLAYGRADFFGPWTGSLSNNTERVRLSKPGVTLGTFDKVDEVTFATEGDWAPRVREGVFNGYDWSSSATAGGHSIELRNPALSNDNGQNWAASTAGAGATPGVVNSVATANIAPIIKAVKHSPAVPKTTDPIRITCELNDETVATGLTVSLRWRNSTATNPGVFNVATMTGDGSGKFSVTLPAQTTNLTILEFYVEASDGVNLRTFPAAVGAEGQVANCNIQINNEVRTATDTYYDMVLTGAESATLNNTQSSDSAGNKIDRQFNITFISSRGGETEIRYRSAVRFRGNSSRGYQVGGVYFKPLRISIPNDDVLDGVTDFALNPRTSFTQHFGNRVLLACGLQAPDTLPVELRRNGVELSNVSTNTGATPDHGKWCRVEEFNGDFATNHFPEATGGNVYKKGRPDEFWRTGGAVPTTPDGLLDGWSKQNNSAANDWTDLTSFFAVVQAAAAPHFTGATAGDVNSGTWSGSAFTAGQIAQLETVADLDQWARWFAAMTILQDNETNISNGQDDDYSIYFAPNALGQRRVFLIPHDLDTIFGLGDQPLAPTARGIYDMTAEASIFKTLLPLIGNSVTTGNADFRLKYHTALRELLGTVFEPTTFDAMVDQHLGNWIPAQTAANMKAFVSTRRSHLLDLIADGVVGGSTATAITPPAATSTAMLGATAANGIVIHEVLASNKLAYANGATFPDVIELRNATASPVNLSGMTLSDDPTVPAKFTFATGTMLGAGELLIIHADTANAEPGLHAGFQLDADGDSVFLYAGGGALVDSITFGVQVDDLSVGRTGGTLNTWALCTPTIGANNTPVAALASPALLKINEWGPNPDYLLSGDFMELYNPSAQPAPIGGMRITDDAINYPSRHLFPTLSFIRGSGFLRLNARGNSASASNATELGFSFNSSFGHIVFLGANGTKVDSVPVIGQPRDTSMGRSPDGGATIVRFSLPTNPPSPGASNVAPPANVLNLINFLRITEILFRPNTLEFIELTNTGTVALDLSGVQFTSGVGYTFEQGTMLAPGAFIVVCKDRAAFVLQYGLSIPLAAGAFTGTLDNAGETIALQPPAPWNLNILNFTYDTDWFVDATANHSFTTVNVAGTAARDWNEKETWLLSTQPLGTPGNDGPPILTSALTANGTAGTSFSYQITAAKSPASFDATGLPLGLSVNTATGLISGTTSLDGDFNVTISATNTTGTDSDTLVLTFVAPPLPVITSTLAVNGSVDVLFSYRIVATSNPTSYAAAGLPAWLSFDAGTHTLSGTPPVVGVFNVTISATNSVGTDTETLVIDVTAVGPFSRFAWDNVSTQIGNTPFTATLRAVDAANRMVDYDGSVVVGARSVVGVMLTELGCSSPGTPDYFELQNLSTATVDTTGWFVITSSSSQGVNVPLATSWALPASLTSGQIVGATDNTPSTNETYYGTDIDWPNNGPRGWVLLSDASGVIRDFCAWGYTAAELGTINFTFGGFTYTLGSQWTGNGAAIPLSGNSLFRTSSTDTNSAANWSLAATPSPRGAQNSGLIIGGVSLATRPVDAVLVDGIWTGSVSILDVALAQLTANAAAAPQGISNAFEVTAPTLNTPPLFSKGPSSTVPMDSGTQTISAWATNIRAGASSETTQTVSFNVVAGNLALFSVQPAVASNGTLTFTPALHAAGSTTISVTPQDNGGIAGGGIDTGVAQTFTITVQPNIAPKFVKGANISIGEDTGANTISNWATSISAGAGEIGQTLSFIVTNTANSLFSTQPAVAPDGTLTFTLAGETPGFATVSVTAVDDGGGANFSATQTFSITVLGVNNAPSFTPGADVSVRHNVGTQTLADWATAISAGPGEAQSLAFEVTTPQSTLFITQPAISASGTLTFNPHPLRGGVATITATLRDNGGTATGGVDFVTHTFTITTRAVNDAPSFVPSTTTINAGVSRAYTSPTAFATAILAGPSDEASQAVSFLISNDRPDLFASAPTLLPSGVLTFTAGPTPGRATLTIRAKDNGGVADGGVDESAPLVLNIRISSVLEAVGNYYARLEPTANVVAPDYRHFGSAKLTLGKGGALTGSVILSGKKFSLKGTVSDIGGIKIPDHHRTVLVRKPDPSIPSDPINVILTLTFNNGDTPSFKITIGPSNSVTMSECTATRPLYSKVALVPTTILDPLTDKGKYAAALLALTAPNNGKSATEYPQGDGVGALTISKTGGVKLKGKLADGTGYATSSFLLAGDTVPFYLPLYGGKGLLSGTATARSLASSDFDGSSFDWFRPAIVKLVHPGWATGITVDFIATKILPKMPPLFPTLAATDADGNAAVDLTDATLGTKAVNIDVKNKILILTPAADKLKASVSVSKGTWSGSFISPATGKAVKYSGVILRKAGYGTGYYLDGVPGGRVSLTPAP